jgi:hypothetical protein
MVLFVALKNRYEISADLHERDESPRHGGRHEPEPDTESAGYGAEPQRGAAIPAA